MKINQFVQEHFKYAEEQFKHVFTHTPAELKDAIGLYVQDNVMMLSTLFYEEMMQDAQAKQFLNHDMVNQRLKHSLAQWLIQLFGTSSPIADEISDLIARQFEVGEVHARIQIPINLVSQGARFLKKSLLEKFVTTTHLKKYDVCAAAIYINELIDLSLEIMNLGFSMNHDMSTRVDEVYRLNAFGHNIAIEKEKQKAALLEWSHSIVFAIQKNLVWDEGKLSKSDFGLWLSHKALTLFGPTQDFNNILASVHNIDTLLLPQIIEAHRQDDREQYFAMLSHLQSEIQRIKYILSSLFERVLELESGKDALTHLLNRRFLPSVLNREIKISREKNQTFAVLLSDIDHFKKINDSYGHDAGDVVLQQIASLMTNHIRSGDFIFRYGGEEILIILVEVSGPESLKIAENIRQKIESHNILLPNDNIIRITISTGIALFSGHPDYEYLIKKADVALYKAKKTGRNRCVFNDEE